MTITPPHPPFIAARWHGGAQTPKLIVLHSTVGPTKTGSAEGVAKFFAREDNKTSAHYVVDESTTFQCVGDHTVAYHCGYNQDSIGVEMCDNPATVDKNGNTIRAPKSRWDNEAHRHLELRAAHLVARLCVVYKIPPYYRGVLALKLGRKGVTTHNNMSLAFKRSTHWDPGAWRRLRFMREVRRHYRYLKSKG